MVGAAQGLLRPRPAVVRPVRRAGSAGSSTGDLGTSWRTGKPVVGLILERLPVTLELTMLVGGVRAGARHAGGRRCPRSAATARSTMSRGWAPSSGSRCPCSGRAPCSSSSSRSTSAGCRRWCGWTSSPTPGATSPSCCCPPSASAPRAAANIARTTRACMLDVLRSGVHPHRLRQGLARGAVILKHALRNALIPVVTVAGCRWASSSAAPWWSRRCSRCPGWGGWCSGPSTSATIPHPEHHPLHRRHVHVAST